MGKKCVPTGAKLTPSHTLCAPAGAVGAEEDECDAEQGAGCLLLVATPPAALHCSFVVSHLETRTLATITAPESQGFTLKLKTAHRFLYGRNVLRNKRVRGSASENTLMFPLYDDKGLLISCDWRYREDDAAGCKISPPQLENFATVTFWNV